MSDRLCGNIRTPKARTLNYTKNKNENFGVHRKLRIVAESATKIGYMSIIWQLDSKYLTLSNILRGLKAQSDSIITPPPRTAWNCSHCSPTRRLRLKAFLTKQRRETTMTPAGCGLCIRSSTHSCRTF